MSSALRLPYPFPVTDGTLQLSDGRALGYLMVGSPDGLPLLHCHGEPSSRLEVLLFAEPAAALGIRLIGLDRPGIGQSDPRPGMRPLDFADDVVEATDQLGIREFALSGFSGGSAFALACAYKNPERVLACGVISAVPPVVFMQQAGPPGMRLSYALLGLLPAALFRPLVRRTMGQGARASETQMENTLKRNGARLGAGDQTVLQNLEVRRVLAQTAVESYRQGVEANAEQALLLTRNWGFPLAAIRVATLALWHGMQDRIMPVAPARLLAKALPQCQAQFYPDTGHLSTLITHAPDILQTLVASSKSTSG